MFDVVLDGGLSSLPLTKTLAPAPLSFPTMNRLFLFVLGSLSSFSQRLYSRYGKTALGMDRDHMYVYFMKKTGPQRMRAFTGFTTSLLLFCIQGTYFNFHVDTARR